MAPYNRGYVWDTHSDTSTEESEDDAGFCEVECLVSFTLQWNLSQFQYDWYQCFKEMEFFKELLVLEQLRPSQKSEVSGVPSF